jgi:hypothetical protein
MCNYCKYNKKKYIYIVDIVLSDTKKSLKAITEHGESTTQTKKLKITKLQEYDNSLQILKFLLLDV